MRLGRHNCTEGLAAGIGWASYEHYAEMVSTVHSRKGNRVASDVIRVHLMDADLDQSIITETQTSEVKADESETF